MRTSPSETLGRILTDRWTCRQFLPEPVPRATIEQLLLLAQRTPSWCNTQPWQVHVTAGVGTRRFRDGLLAHVQSHPAAPDFPFPATYTGAYRERRKEAGIQLYGSLGIAKGDQEGALLQMLRNFELFDAPHIAVITTEDDLGVYGAVDCGLYISTFLLAAHSLGLATAPQAAIASQSPFIHDHFDIPENRRVVAGISFGHPDLDHPANSFRTTREHIDHAVTWHTD